MCCYLRSEDRCHGNNEFKVCFFEILAVWFAYKHRASGGFSKMAVNWLQNQLITNNELLDPVLFFRSVLYTHWHIICYSAHFLVGYFSGRLHQVPKLSIILNYLYLQIFLIIFLTITTPSLNSINILVASLNKMPITHYLFSRSCRYRTNRWNCLCRREWTGIPWGGNVFHLLFVCRLLFLLFAIMYYCLPSFVLLFNFL